MSGFSSLFIKRPVASSLLGMGILFAGALAFFVLPVASLPSVDLPTLRVTATQPGADPETMATTIAAPLERQLGAIAGVTEITSTSSLGATAIAVQFDINRPVDKAARDVQAAINAAAYDLPSDLPSLPLVRKLNPAAFPVLVLALTSDTIPNSALYDIADTVIAQRLSQVAGVAEVSVNGAEQPAIRISLDPNRLAAIGVGIDAVRTAVMNANALGPLGAFEGTHQTEMLASNAQLQRPEDYQSIIVANRNGAAIRLGDIADIRQGVRNNRAAGWFNGKPAVILQITKQPDANVIETVDAVKALLPELGRWIPAGVKISTLTDRTESIRSSIRDLMKTLVIAILLVMGVVLVFLRSRAQTIAVGVSVPLSIAGSFAAMWVAGFTLDTLSLMAITIAVGFVVDDAIVVVENVHRHIEAGDTPLNAALKGAQELGFTVLSISLSLGAAFIPMIFMEGIIGRLFREFALTLVFAIAVSTFVSLTIAPVICSKLLRQRAPDTKPFWLDRWIETALDGLASLYAMSLKPVLRHPWLTLVVFCMVIAATVNLFRTLPKGFFPQDDIGLIFGSTEAAPDISFARMSALQQKISDIVSADSSVSGVASFIGASGGLSTVNQGRLLVSLKPFSERQESSAAIVARLRKATAGIVGIRLFMASAQDFRAGARSGKSPLQFTLWGQDLKALQEWGPKAEAALKAAPELADVSTDKTSGGLQLDLTIDRVRAARLGVKFTDIDAALNDAFGQRQIATFYTPRNQYKTVLAVNKDKQSDPSDLSGIYVPGAKGVQVPIETIAHMGRGLQPLAINHQGQFASVTITYDMAEGVTQDAAMAAVKRAILDLHLPETVNSDFAGDAKAFATSAGSQPLLILAAVLAVYLILGILYESLIHPITILSTLPSAALGALLALKAAGLELSLIAIIGIILLIGIVKKNGIILVDFAQSRRREINLSALLAMTEACRVRFRPILMTTMASMLGALPLLLATGPGAELRRPLGVTIIGGLLLSQILTLYTTPVIYLLMDRLTRRRNSENPQASGVIK
jgi:hydrophobe/amphiphile efflux-1 (HAE1) family protein